MELLFEYLYIALFNKVDKSFISLLAIIRFMDRDKGLSVPLVALVGRCFESVVHMIKFLPCGNLLEKGNFSGWLVRVMLMRRSLKCFI
jgi:hypothetical protein